MKGKRSHYVWITLLKLCMLALMVLLLSQPMPTFDHNMMSYPLLAMVGSSLTNEVAPPAKTFTVMTYNIRHARTNGDPVSQLESIAEAIRAVEADIVGLQEVDRYIGRSGTIDQVRWLGDQLDMSWVYAPAIGAGWMQYGNAVLSRFPLRTETIEMTVMPGRTEPRSLLRIVADVHGFPVTIGNTHLGVHEDERQEQWPVLLDNIGGWSEASVLMGDFNMDVDDPLLEYIPFSWKRLPAQGATLANGKQVDHIWVRGPMEALDISIPSFRLSDHEPVLATLKIVEEN